jgi:hypothetical protein
MIGRYRCLLASFLLVFACSEPETSQLGARPTATQQTVTSSAVTAAASADSASPSAVPTVVHSASVPNAPKTVAFVGDISISMIVGAHLDGSLKPSTPLEPGYPFGKVQDRLRAYDLLVGNLECVVTNRGQPTIKKPLKAPLDSGKRLLDAGFDVVSVANNHVQDMADAGYADMMARLDADGLPYAGGNLVDKSRSPTVVKDLGGVRVAVIGH